jgi:hypothetical protein
MKRIAAFAVTVAILGAPISVMAQTKKGTPPSSPGSSEYAPGQKQTDPGTAKNYAPGQKQTDPGTAKNYAPGQKDNPSAGKKN